MNLPEQKNSADFTQAIRTSKIEKIPTDEAAKRMNDDMDRIRYLKSLTTAPTHSTYFMMD